MVLSRWSKKCLRFLVERSCTNEIGVPNCRRMAYEQILLQHRVPFNDTGVEADEFDAYLR